MVATSTRGERITIAIEIALIVIVLALQARLLYVFPQPDSSRWWGDETGQMLELRAELQHGYASIPTGLGSSVAITNGIVRGNSWLAAFVYGIPVLIFQNVADVVSIGRTVTFLLSLVLLYAMYRAMRSLDITPTGALLAILLLISTRSFFFASHAARLDIAAGLTIVVYASYLSSQYSKLKEGRWHPSYQWFFAYGAIAMLFATLSIHLLTLLAALSVYMLVRFGAAKRPSALLSAFGGVIVTLSLLLLVYVLSGAKVSLFGPSAASNQFQSVAGGLPILRPFSRSVQVANLMERLQGFINEAPLILLLVFVFVLLVVIKWKKICVRRDVSFYAGSVIVVVIAWLLLESPALYYYLQVLPVVVVGSFVIFVRADEQPLEMERIRRWAFVLGCVSLAGSGIRHTQAASELSHIIANDNRSAINEALDSVHVYGDHPIVLAQNPAIAQVEFDRNVRLMTPHIVSFSISRKPLAEQLDSIGVKYLLLYSPGDRKEYSDDHSALQPIADRNGEVVLRKTGRLFDVRRDYFDSLSLSRLDTLTLYRLKFAH